MSEGIRYLHVRAVKYNGRGQETYNRGSVTLAYCYLEEGGFFVVGAAFCAPGDAFSRARGRAIATGRLHQRMVEGAHAQCTTATKGPEPGATAESLVALLRSLRGRPYLGYPQFDGPRWYPAFLAAVEKGHVLRRRAA